MLYGSGRVLWGALLLAGLCAPAHANTTIIIAQNDLAMPRPGARDPSAPVEANRAAIPAATPAAPTVSATVPAKKMVRVALLLPLLSDNLRQAAEVVRAGFWAAHEREKDDGMTFTVVETGDAAQDVLSGYAFAVKNHDIVVGPLSRSGVSAIAQSGAIDKPTIALTQTDTADTETVLPPGLLMIGLSIADEARQMASWIVTQKDAKKAMVVSTNAAWQRRAAKAFGAQWQLFGLSLQSMEIGVSGGFLNAASLEQLRKRLQADKPDLLFVALDAEQAAQVREAIGHDVALYGTSQLNPRTLPEWTVADRVPEMNGVRLLDLPWQLQADHPSVMAYPRQAEPEQKRGADQERLYALGIDAYRVTREIAANNSAFEIDGVTGKLTIRFGPGPSRFERVVSPAIYQDGIVVPVAQ